MIVIATEVILSLFVVRESSDHNRCSSQQLRLSSFRNGELNGQSDLLVLLRIVDRHSNDGKMEFSL